MTQIIVDILRLTIIAGAVIAGILAILIWIKDLTKKISSLRLFIQIATVPIIFLGLIIGPFQSLQSSPLGIAPRDALVVTDIL